jgi:hypothetical protein
MLVARVQILPLLQAAQLVVLVLPEAQRAALPLLRAAQLVALVLPEARQVTLVLPEARQVALAVPKELGLPEPLALCRR